MLQPLDFTGIIQAAGAAVGIPTPERGNENLSKLLQQPTSSVALRKMHKALSSASSHTHRQIPVGGVHLDNGF
ncbi:MAG: hypothetical protein EA420_06605 [Candidatus Competibacteraceae bacterium]|nr:MAG: hypothetical protein EA420_06605 [Candidatus Competibacteraceae bacterium]